MYFSLKGTITHLFVNSIVIDVNNVSYEILVSDITNFKLGDIKVIYTYLYSNEMEEYLVGFNNLKEKDLFISLISVKGIGPKTALNILGHADIDELLNAINNSNVLFLKKLPGIGNKSASQIILDLKGKLTIENNNDFDEIKIALKNLGFKTFEIDNALAKIKILDKSKEEILKESLRLLRK